MSDDLSAASAAAAEMIQSGAADAPAAEGEGFQSEPTPEPAATADETFSREYVEELRQEAARYRTRSKPYEEAFAHLSESERNGFLALAQDLQDAPDRALEGFERVVENLRERIGTSQIPADGSEPSMLTPEQVQKLVDAKLRERDEAAAADRRVQEVFENAARLSDAYKPGSDALVQLLHVAQTDPAANGTLEGAHYVLMGKLQTLMDQAVEEYRAGLSPSTRRPVDGGTPTTGKPVEAPRTIEEAGARAREILGRTMGR